MAHTRTHTHKGDNDRSMCCEYVTFDNAKNIASPWRLFDKLKNTPRTIVLVDFKNIDLQEF